MVNVEFFGENNRESQPDSAAAIEKIAVALGALAALNPSFRNGESAIGITIRMDSVLGETITVVFHASVIDLQQFNPARN